MNLHFCCMMAYWSRAETPIMTDQDSIIINRDLEIPLEDLAFRFSRSGGPGGQHANRSETRVELIFDVASSPSLTEAQRELLLDRLSPMLDREGLLHLASGRTRSQHQNRQAVIARFQALLQRALRQRKRRRPTRPSRAARDKRLEEKRQLSAKKRARRPPPGIDE
jgi:ribosome-associated protein